MKNESTRREFLRDMSMGVMSAALIRESLTSAQPEVDHRLEISSLRLEIAPGKNIETTAYNGTIPGPLIRWPENKPIRIQVTNRTDVPEIVHCHGLFNSPQMDGAMEEGSPMIAPGASLVYEFAPRPAGFRWYHTHTFAGHNLRRGLYSGQFGCFYVEAKSDPGAYDQEVFLTVHDWNAYMGGGGDASMEAVYDYGTINGRMLGHGDPIRVLENQRVLIHLLNASATLTHWISLSGHQMQVAGMDGNPVPRAANVSAVRLAPAERVDLVVEMNHPGVWVMGETRKELREAGIGVVVEYANQTGPAKWVDPPETTWDYAQFADSAAEARQPDAQIPLVFQSKFAGHGDFDRWTINGKSFPHTDTIPLEQGKRYRLQMTNKSADPHPIHLHRHSFELTNIGGKPVSGLLKDVVLIEPGVTTVDFTADNPGSTLFHCHQQNHMDFGFMMLFAYR